MKKAKRILAGALAALILTMSLPLSALADEADVPVESPSFEVSFDVDTGQEEISEDPPADIEATPEPTPEPTAEPTQEPTPTPESTATPAPTAEPTAVPTATPGVTATPTAVPTSTPEPSAVPSASPVVTPTSTPTPTPSPQPVVNPVKLEHDVLDNVDKVCIYLFPVPNSSEITQEYSAEHKAIDIAASSGSPVYAAEDGTVSYVQIWDGSYDTTGMMSYGHMVEVRHADGNTTLYAHLSEINVQQGEKVVRGQRIGRVGSTGNATGPHLHFEVITSEGKADPAEYLWTMPGEWIMGYAADTEAGISPTAVGNTGKSVIHFYSLAKETTTTVTGSFVLVILLGAGAAAYPLIASINNEHAQSLVQVEYEEKLEQLDTSEIDAALAAAREYNKTISTMQIEDVDKIKESLPPYEDLLNLANNGIMGYIEIPAINIDLPIYHGTTGAAMEKGAGHMEGTSLPVGGVGTHAVISAHSGMASAKLFTDLDKLEIGDIFIITVCNQKLAYEVDNIAVVEPTDIDLIRIDTQQDYVTLLTCTPYGVNTHRLLVRGHRVDMAEEAIAEVEDKVEPAASTWIERYEQGLVIGLITSFAAMLLLLLILLIRRRQKKKTGNIAGSERK